MTDKRRLLFVLQASTGAAHIRGIQIANYMRAFCGYSCEVILAAQFLLREYPTVADSIIVIVKYPENLCGGRPDFYESLKKRGNVLVVDVVDSFCHDATNPLINKNLGRVYDVFDLVIHCSKFQSDNFSRVFKKPISAVVLHQWDLAILYQIEYAANNIKSADKIYYRGSKAGLQLDTPHALDYVEIDYDSHDFTRMFLFQFHLSFRVRNSLDFLFKPCSKLAFSAATGAILISSRDPACVEVLGSNYGFFIENAAELQDLWVSIKRGDVDLERGRKLMSAACELLSPRSVCLSYATALKVVW